MKNGFWDTQSVTCQCAFTHLVGRFSLPHCLFHLVATKLNCGVIPWWPLVHPFLMFSPFGGHQVHSCYTLRIYHHLMGTRLVFTKTSLMFFLPCGHQVKNMLYIDLVATKWVSTSIFGFIFTQWPLGRYFLLSSIIFLT